MENGENGRTGDATRAGVSAFFRISGGEEGREKDGRRTYCLTLSLDFEVVGH